MTTPRIICRLRHRGVETVTKRETSDTGVTKTTTRYYCLDCGRELPRSQRWRNA